MLTPFCWKHVSHLCSETELRLKRVFVNLTMAPSLYFPLIAHESFCLHLCTHTSVQKVGVGVCRVCVCIYMCLFTFLSLTNKETICSCWSALASSSAVFPSWEHKYEQIKIITRSKNENSRLRNSITANTITEKNRWDRTPPKKSSCCKILSMWGIYQHTDRVGRALYLNSQSEEYETQILITEDWVIGRIKF